MSSVLDIIECPMCGHGAHKEFFCHNSTTWILCFICGYLYREYILIDRKHEKKTGEKIYKLTKDEKWIIRVREKINYGGFFLKQTKGSFTAGGFPKPITKKDIEDFSKYIDHPGMDREESYLLSFDPTTKELTAVIGKIPERAPY